MSSRALPDPAQRLRAIHLARARLAPLAHGELLNALPASAARACGLQRALLVLVTADQLVAASGCADEAPADDLLQLAAARHAALAERPLEAEVVASGRPALSAGDGGMLRAPGAFVVAPLVHPDRAIALLYGDRPAGPALDELDRELLWTYAVALAPVLHVATLAAIARDQPTHRLAVRPRRDIG